MRYDPGSVEFRPWSVDEMKNLPFFVKHMDDLKKELFPLSVAADRVRDYLSERRCPQRYVALHSAYQQSLQNMLARSLGKIPADFLRFTLSLHYTDHVFSKFCCF